MRLEMGGQADGLKDAQRRRRSVDGGLEAVFQGSRITAHAGLLAYRELDEA